MKPATNINKKWILTIALTVVLGLGVTLAGAQDLTPTPFSMDFYGMLAGAATGDRITVRDADGVLCGAYQVDKPGRYGFLHVYGDDPGTAADEGAVYGDVLYFERNGDALTPTTGEPVRWQGDRQRLRVDF